MSILDMMFGTADDEEERAAQKLVSTYFKYHAADEILGKAGNYLTSNGDDDRLRHEDMVLDIAAKKRALGLPYDDADYEEATNQNRPFRTKGVIAAFGKRTSDMVPEPGFLQAHNGLDSVLPYSMGRGGDRMGESLVASFARRVPTGADIAGLARKIPYRLSSGVTNERPSILARIFRK